jgi:hypothetical protein
VSAKERPILFSGPMVRALLEGRKTQTRRAVRLDGTASRPAGYGTCVVLGNGHGWRAEWPDHPGWRVPVKCPYGVPGDRLWVRETWSRDSKDVYPCIPVVYRADGRISDEDRREHVRDCKYEATGMAHFECLACPNHGRGLRWRPSIHMPRRASRITLEVTEVRVQRLQDISEEDARAEGVEYREHFFRLWGEMHGEDNWLKDPWVWAISFKPAPPPSQHRKG